MSLNFSDHIINWYFENKRNLPWRNTKDPYKIWLSEIILQQTQVKQGLPYYLKFVKNFPNVYQLAHADEGHIMKMWQGLGYYSRARNLHFTAKTIVNDYNGVFPNTYKGLLKLKGVGEYTAAAIASFAYNEPVAVLDGNVFRVLSRYLGIDTPINSTEGQKLFKLKVNELLDKDRPALYNQAIMEFGALLCRPKSPDCMFCSLNSSCVAFQQNKIKDLPVKLKKLKRRKRYFNYLVVESEDNELILQQRLKKDIWQKLFEFPLIETQGQLEKKDVKNTQLFKILGLDEDVSIHKVNRKTYKHVLTHQDIFADFWSIKCSFEFDKNKLENYSIVNSNSIRTFAVPILIDRFLNKHFLEN
jgi:A/G-specific adenine glycosylase